MQIIERDTGDVNCILLRDKFAQAFKKQCLKETEEELNSKLIQRKEKT